jgi:outer membrane autotransporter protein
LSYTATSVQLTLSRNAAAFTSQAQTPNQLAVAGALTASPQGSGLVQAVQGQSAAGAQLAFNALSGEIFGSIKENLIDGSFELRQEILNRLRQAGYTGITGDLGALAFGGPDLRAGEEQASALAYAGIPVKAAPRVPAASRDLTVWAQGLGGRGRVDTDGNAAALGSSFAGIVGGFDARLGAARLGVAGGYTHSSVNVDARASSAGIDSAHVGAYAGANLGLLDLRGGAAYSFHTINTTRTIAFRASSTRRPRASTAAPRRCSARWPMPWRSGGLRSSRSPASHGFGRQRTGSSKPAGSRHSVPAAPRTVSAIPRSACAPLPTSCWQTAPRSSRARRWPGSTHSTA